MKRIERLVNLVALLADSERPLALHEISQRLPGYDPEAGEATRRSFERDKDAVRSMGIDLETVPIDPLVGPGPENVGYVIAGGDEKISDPGLTLAERGVLAVASSLVWETEVPADGDDAAIDAAGLDLDAVRPPALVEVFLDAIADRRKVGISYQSSGASESAQRTISPYGLVHRRGHWYVAGDDSRSKEVRSFRLDRMSADVRVGAPAAFARPMGFHMQDAVPERGWEFGAGSLRMVRLAVDPDELWWIAPQAGVGAGVDAFEVDGSAWPVLEVPVRNTSVFVGWVLSLLDAAVVVDPPAVRAVVEDELAAVCEVDA